MKLVRAPAYSGLVNSSSRYYRPPHCFAMPCAPCSHIVCPQKRAVALNASPKNPAGRSVARRDTSELLNPDLDEMQLDDAYYAEIGMTREEAMRQQKEMLYNIDPDAMLLDDIGKVDESLPEEWRNAIESLEVYGPQALIMAGFRAEEYAIARTTLDQLGADQIKVLPATEEMLQDPLDLALATPEVDWSAPRPPDWISGGAWGSQRAIMFSGLSLKAQATILEYLEAQGLPPVCVTMALKEDGQKRLGELLAAAVQAQRNMKAPKTAPWEVRRQAAAGSSGSSSSSSSATRRGIELSGMPGKRGPLFSRRSTTASSSSSSRRLNEEGLDDLQNLISPEMAKQRLRVNAAELGDELTDVIDIELTEDNDSERQQQQQQQRQSSSSSDAAAAAAAGSSDTAATAASSSGSSSVPYDTSGMSDEAKAMLEWFHDESTGKTVELPFLEDEPPAAAAAAAAAAMGVGADAGSSRAADLLGLDILLDDLLPSSQASSSSSSAAAAAAAAGSNFTTATSSSGSSRVLDPSNADDDGVSVFSAIQSALKSGVDPEQLKQLIDAAAAASAAASDPVDLLLNDDAAMQQKVQQTSKALKTAAAAAAAAAGSAAGKKSSAAAAAAAAAAASPEPPAEFGPEPPPPGSEFGGSQKPGVFDSDPLLNLRPEIERAFQNDQIKFVDMNKMPKKYKQQYTQGVLQQRMQQQQQKYMQQQQELEQQERRDQQQQSTDSSSSSSGGSSGSDKQRWWQQQRSPQQQQLLQGLASGVAGKLPGGGRVVEMDVTGGIPDQPQQQQQQQQQQQSTYAGQEIDSNGDYINTSATDVISADDSRRDSENQVDDDDDDDDMLFEDAELVGESEEVQESLWFSESQLQDLVDSARTQGLDPSRALAQALAFGVQVDAEVAAAVGVELPSPDMIESARKDIIGSIRDMQASEGLNADGTVVLAEEGYQGFTDTTEQGFEVDSGDEGLVGTDNPAAFRGVEVAAAPAETAVAGSTGAGRVWGSGISSAVSRAKARLVEKKRQEQQQQQQH